MVSLPLQGFTTGQTLGIPVPIRRCKIVFSQFRAPFEANFRNKTSKASIGISIQIDCFLWFSIVLCTRIHRTKPRENRTKFRTNIKKWQRDEMRLLRSKATQSNRTERRRRRAKTYKLRLKAIKKDFFTFFFSSFALFCDFCLTEWPGSPLAA